jgi:TonB-dependent starch-binding outer membrane protein SusC
MRKLLLLLFAFLCVASYATAQRVVTGKVTDSKNNPIENASVIVAGTNTGTVTKADGTYSITVPATAKSITISYVDLLAQSISLSGKTVINATLVAEEKSLQEVVVTGYGTQRKRDVTGSVSNVKGASLANKPVQSFEQALGGRAAGVQVLIPNGALNNPPVIRVRGTNSLSLSSFPLIVIDGVPSFTGDASGTSAAGNALASLNPNDIESIDIAKDAASTAIYGSRAANGVVFITTKRGKSGKAKVNLDSWVGFTNAQRLPELLNSAQYTAYKNEALVNAGTYNATTNSFYQTPGPDGTPIDTRWYDVIYRQGFSHSNNISVSGASEQTNYYFSFGYTSQQGIIKKNDFKRANVLANIDHKITKYLSFGGKISYSNELNLAAASSGSLPGEAFATAGLGRVAFLNSPNVSPYLNNGTYNLNTGAGGTIGVMGNKVTQVGLYNPVMSLDLNRQNSENNHLQGNFYLQLKPVSWVTIRTLYGIDNLITDNETFASGLSGEGFVANSFGGAAASSLSKNKRWIWTNTIQIDKTLGKHNISLLGGHEQQKSDNVGFGLGRTLVSDPFYTNLQGGFTGPPTAAGLGIGENYLLSEFASLKYNFANKYYVSGNVRSDGASQLSKNFKYGTFWGVSAGWEIAKERFWESLNLNNIFSNFKLKSSFGTVGNISGLGNFGTLSTYGAGLYGTGATLVYSNAGNDNLTWETSTKFDLGATFSILKDRVNFEFSYYKNDIDGLILAVPPPPSAGLPNAINTNIGEMYNKGIEFAVNSTVINKKDFTWNLSFNISKNTNKVISLAPTVPQIITATSLESPSITKPGYPVGMIFVTRTYGVDPSTGRRIFINAAGRQVFFDFASPAAQRYKYADGTIAPAVGAVDAQIYKPTVPKTFGGFENTIRFKGFEINALMTFQTGNYIYYGSFAGLKDQRYWNNSIDVLKRWTKPGDFTEIPRAVFGDNISNGSSFPLDVNVFKGDFLKLRSITVGYNLPQVIIDKLKFSNVRFYLSGTNLAILTDYPGPDPETSTNGNGTTNQGVDRNQVANGRTITAGINITF